MANDPKRKPEDEIEIKDLPESEAELTDQQAEDVTGGLLQNPTAPHALILFHTN